MGIGRIRRLAATAGVVALTFGTSALVITQVAAATQTMTATSHVNVRSGPGTSYAVIGVLSPGQTVEASGTVTSGWVKATVDGGVGWIYGSYLAASAPSPAAPSAATPSASGTVTTTSEVNVRSGPGTTFSIVAVAPPGLQLPSTGTVSGNWTQVLYAGAVQWISSSYLEAGATEPASQTTTPPEATAPEAAPATTAPATPGTTGQLRTTLGLYLRTAGYYPSTTDGFLQAGSVVDATGRTTADYSEVVHQGKVRWIATRYTTAVTATSPSAPADPSPPSVPAATAPAETAPSPSVPAAPTASGTVYVTVNSLNVRATSDPASSIVGTVSSGTALKVTGTTSGDRTQVLYLGAARWVYTPYVSATPPAAPTTLSIPATLTTSGISQLNPNARAVFQYVVDHYPRIRTIYGWRASSDYSSDHPSGRALDIMLPTWTDPANADYGWTIAKFFAANAKQFKVNYVIYRQSTFNAAYPERGWRPMEDRGSATANHYDHVHVSVFD